jgi:2-oxoglutarate ferredoxin oxidoreductase subunit beta
MPGQSTATTQKGFKEKTRPLGGNIEEPLNPIALALVSGASFIARANSLDVRETASIIKQAIEWKGTSIVEIVQPCITFNNTIPDVKKKFYKLENHNTSDFFSAMNLAGQPVFEGKIPVGVLWKNPRTIFEEKREILKKLISEKKGFHNISSERNILKDFL